MDELEEDAVGLVVACVTGSLVGVDFGMDAGGKPDVSGVVPTVVGEYSVEESHGNNSSHLLFPDAYLSPFLFAPAFILIVIYS